jgi:antagonist of KipI
MGYRLQGKALEPERKEQLVSSAVNFGTVQLLPSGQLVVLMADHQTTGGYPRVANVISAHLPRLAQMNAGAEIKLVMTGMGEAEEKALAQQDYLHRLQNTCKLKMENWLQQHA